jgi:predicted aminopeptidase
MGRRNRSSRAVIAAAILAGIAVLGGCSSLGYYWQSVSGHLELMRAARPVQDWLADPQTDQQLKAKLELAQRLREFAVSSLHLPDNASYRRYADIGRPSVVWNVVAAPELSLVAKTWCFPVAGCVAYRGYFSEAEARAEAAQLAGQGLEVNVYGVPAYSTLGWLNWAGGDPLLSSFVGHREAELARLLFHELAHQVVYVPDDTSFNESFATAVERIGGRQWLASQGTGDAVEREARWQLRRTAMRSLMQATRDQLKSLYAEHEAGRIDAARAREAKRETMARFSAAYQALRASWLAAEVPDVTVASLSVYDRWIQGANNASLASVASYDEMVPAFEALFERQQRNWPRFYDAVRALAAMPKAQRLLALGIVRKEKSGG